MRTLSRVLHSRSVRYSGDFLLLLALLGILAPVLPLADPIAIDLTAKFDTPSWAHWLGTDLLGRDLLSRMVWGIRETVFTSFAAMVVTLVFGMFWGGLSGALGGRADTVMMRICDAWMSVPSEVLLLAIVGMMGPGTGNIIFACFMAKWPWYARMIRVLVRHIARSGFVQFAWISGSSRLQILWHHLLPNAAGDVFVLATLEAGGIVLMVSTLSFLGLGVSSPSPEWGMMLAEAKNVMTLHPWQMVVPGVMILLTVAAFNFLGDALRDVLDPRSRIQGAQA